jgi:hypothetical protein
MRISDREKRAEKSRWLIGFLGFLLGLAQSFSFGDAALAQQPPPGASRPPDQFSLPDPYALPQPQRLFRLETESQLHERMARDGQLGINPIGLKYDIHFPDYPAVARAERVPREWAPLTETVEPPFVCYRRLFFEQLNFERYGWDLGLVSPLVSEGVFCFDLVTLPYHAAKDPCRNFECNTGYCLPGDPVPLLLYPPEWSLSGGLAELAVIGLGFVVFP